MRDKTFETLNDITTDVKKNYKKAESEFKITVLPDLHQILKVEFNKAYNEQIEAVKKGKMFIEIKGKPILDLMKKNVAIYFDAYEELFNRNAKWKLQEWLQHEVKSYFDRRSYYLEWDTNRTSEPYDFCIKWVKTKGWFQRKFEQFFN
jgi:hypothetical protein